MTRTESASITISRHGSRPQDSDGGRTVVWLPGDHDIVTNVYVVVGIARRRAPR